MTISTFHNIVFRNSHRSPLLYKHQSTLVQWYLLNYRRWHSSGLCVVYITIHRSHHMRSCSWCGLHTLAEWVSAPILQDVLMRRQPRPSVSFFFLLFEPPRSLYLRSHTLTRFTHKASRAVAPTLVWEPRSPFAAETYRSDRQTERERKRERHIERQALSHSKEITQGGQGRVISGEYVCIDR